MDDRLAYTYTYTLSKLIRAYIGIFERINIYFNIQTFLESWTSRGLYSLPIPTKRPGRRLSQSLFWLKLLNESN